MPTELIIAAALANCGRDAPTGEFLEMLAEGSPDLAIFRFQPRHRPGIGVRAAIDWQAILGTAADLLAFAGLIWAAYERYVKPKRETHTESPAPFLFIQVRRPDGSFIQCNIGHEFQDKDVFIEHFVREATALRSDVPSEADESVLSEISQNEDWVRIQVTSRKNDS